MENVLWPNGKPISWWKIRNMIWGNALLKYWKCYGSRSCTPRWFPLESSLRLLGLFSITGSINIIYWDDLQWAGRFQAVLSIPALHCSTSRSLCDPLAQLSSIPSCVSRTKFQRLLCLSSASSTWFCLKTSLSNSWTIRSSDWKQSLTKK